MKALTGWSFGHYVPPHKADASCSCRIAPFAGGFEADIKDSGEHTVFYRKRGAEEWLSLKTAGSVRLEGLEDNTDYEFYAEDSSLAHAKPLVQEAPSSVRLVRTGEVPGTVINYLHPEDTAYSFSGRYLCSPSIVRLASGRLLASMDVYAPGAPQNLTMLFASDDDGSSWHHVCELFPCFWGKLFVNGGRLYMLGISTEYGDVLIGSSEDEGRTWSVPTVLYRGSGRVEEPGFHRAPMPILEHKGRIYTDIQFGCWRKKHFLTAVLSAESGADLLDPGVWTLSDFWDPLSRPETAASVGGIEGNIVCGPDGRLYDFMRYADGKALVLAIDAENPGSAPVFDRMVDFKTSASKFALQKDPVTGKYISLVSFQPAIPQTDRNLLSLVWSENLTDWRLGSHIIDRSYMDPRQVAFQYADFIFSGDNILFLSRTAYNGAHNYHDSNLICFHTIRNFRRFLKQAG